MTIVGVWLVRSPRHTKFAVFLGPMFRFRLLGIIFIVFGVFTMLVGAGLESIGSVPIKVK